MSIKDIKATGRTVFKANYWGCVIAALLLSLLLGGAVSGSARNVSGAAGTVSSKEEAANIVNSLSEQELAALAFMLVSVSMTILVIGLLLKIFLFNPLKVGCYRFFSKNVYDQSTRLGVIKEGFGNYGHTLVTLFLTDLFIFLWSLLFLIPGIIKAYSYRLVPYIIKDHPELSATEVITRSRELMKGNKGKAFVLDLSFIGWLLLGALTLGLLNLFWTNPYRESAGAVFYHDLIRQ